MTREAINTLERLIGQFNGLHREISTLAKKSPNDAVNQFKLKFVNANLADANEFLGDSNRPSTEFDQFDPDTVPSNSDVTFVLSLYMQALEKYRSDNVSIYQGRWCYNMAGDDKIRGCKKICVNVLRNNEENAWTTSNPNS